MTARASSVFFRAISFWDGRSSKNTYPPTAMADGDLEEDLNFYLPYGKALSAPGQARLRDSPNFHQGGAVEDASDHRNCRRINLGIF